MPRKLDYIDLLIRQGARVLPPRKKDPVLEPPAAIPETEVVHPVEIPVESITTVEQPDVEALAETLDKAWSTHIPDIRPVSAEPDKTFSDRQVRDLIGQVVEGHVISWNRNSAGYFSGFVRTKQYGRTRGSLYFKEENVVTVGEISVGTEVRFLVQDSDGKSLEAHDVEIYRD